MLQAIASARSPLVAAAIGTQWSEGLSELARRMLAELSESTVRSLTVAARTELRDELRRAAAGLAVMQRLLHPAEVVLAGPPNAGKSTLANALVGRSVSIVHETAGTTRDWIRELALIHGVPVWVTDTAGDCQLTDCPLPIANCQWNDKATAAGHLAIESESIRRARHRVSQADVVLLLSAETKIDVPSWICTERVIRVGTKMDVLHQEEDFDIGTSEKRGEGILPLRLAGVPPGDELLCRNDREQDALGTQGRDALATPGSSEVRTRISARTGEGLDKLGEAILRKLQLAEVDWSAPRAFTQRQAGLLTRVADAMDAGNAGGAATFLRALLEGE